MGCSFGFASSVGPGQLPRHSIEPLLFGCVVEDSCLRAGRSGIHLPARNLLGGGAVSLDARVHDGDRLEHLQRVVDIWRPNAGAVSLVEVATIAPGIGIGLGFTECPEDDLEPSAHSRRGVGTGVDLGIEGVVHVEADDRV